MAKQFNKKSPNVAKALACNLSASRASYEAMYVELGHLFKACKVGEMVPADGGKYLVARIEAHVERERKAGFDVPMRQPNPTEVSAMSSLLGLFVFPWRERFMHDCESLGIAWSFLKRAATWARDNHAKDGPKRADILKFLTAKRAESNAGKSGKRSAKRKANGIGRKPDPVARLNKLIELASDYIGTFKDSDGFMATALRSMKQETKRAAKLKEEQKKD